MVNFTLKTLLKYSFVLLISLISFKGYATNSYDNSYATKKSETKVFNFSQSPATGMASIVSEVENKLADFSRSADFYPILKKSFGTGTGLENQAWLTRAADLQSALSSGKYHVNLELRNATELNGAFAAFANKGHKGEATIYLNSDWMAKYTSSADVQKVLLEELGHSFDQLLNQNVDTNGDEGAFFASLVLGNSLTNLQTQRIASENDHNSISIEGKSVQVENAAVYFNEVYLGTKTNPNIATTVPLIGYSFKFSATGTTFTGNNVSGTFSYFNSSGRLTELSGRISFKVGQGEAFYFEELDANGIATANQYILINPFYDNIYDSGQTGIKVNASGVDTELNELQDFQADFPILLIADGTASEGDGFLYFNVTITKPITTNVTFTPALNPGTATTPSDYTNSIQYYNGTSWQSGLVTIPVSLTPSIQLRIAIVDDTTPTEAQENFSVGTGQISGGGLVNYGGAGALATIVDNDIPPSGLLYNTPNLYTKTISITSLNPTVGGGPVTSYAITPNLTTATGLSFNTTTGVISGTPTIVTPIATYKVVATNSYGKDSTTLQITVKDIVPIISYNTPNVYTKDTAIPSLSPASTGGPVVSYTISPALPTGLNFNTGTGIISGNPSVLSTVRTYTVIGINSGGSDTTTLDITVNDVKPSALAYNTPNVYTKNTAISSLTPTKNGGTVIAYTISPTLPAGLLFDTTTGIISGNPSALSTVTTYKVVASNTGGKDSTTLDITVNDVKPSALAYNTPNVYTKNTAISSLTPTKNGGTVIAYTISPTLPAGLLFDTTTGIISGNPSALSTVTTYKVVASNTGGKDSTTLDITVNDVKPSALAYNTPNVFTKGVAITSLSPTKNGGTVIAYTISPALPTGLLFDTTTGIISGNPSALSTATTYKVVASNSGGKDSTNLQITVKDFLPVISYNTPNVYTKDTAIPSLSPNTAGGGPVVSYTISPALPTGLNFNTATGIISGNPSVLSTVRTYTVIGINSGGSDTTTLDITVNDVKPSALAYNTPNVYTKNTAISSLTPTKNGGTVIAYTISPALPAGLLFDTTTGIISGNPSALSTVTTYKVVASNTGGKDSTTLDITVNDVKPSALAYNTPNVYTKNTAISSLTPTKNGGTVIAYTISPALPAGLSFDTTTGIISGNPSALSTVTTYKVVASNSGGKDSTNLDITVNDVKPSSLSYNTPNVFTKGVAITSLSPTKNGGTVIAYTISPALPTGLLFDTTTGIISGNPSVLSTITTYKVVASNSGGKDSTELQITVKDFLPVISYNTPNVFTNGTAISDLNPDTDSGGPVVSYTISPALPTGLNFNTATGIISGNPSVLSTVRTYTVIGINSGGSDTTTLDITVNDVKPSALAYTTPNVYTKRVSTVSLSPSVSGGPVVSYSISPALPGGVTLNPSTGVISGMPSGLSALTTYTVIATNTGGSDTTTLDITVNDLKPSALAYTTPNVYTKNTAISSLSPSVSGGPVTGYTISPALPTGLLFDTTTGIISGTPSALSTVTTYKVVASNSGGKDSTNLDITVNDVKPSSLSYNTPNVFTKNTAISSLSPSVNGGPVTGYTISPALPTGLSFDTNTGIISGTSIVLNTVTTYKVVASNSGGKDSTTLDITVNDVIPNISYNTPNVYTKNTAISSLSPRNTGGAILDYSISPNLNSNTGLSFDVNTGIISGTPNKLSTITTYSVIATNSGGRDTTTFQITVNDVKPSALAYNTPNVFTNGTAISSLSPSVSGGPVTGYTISPALPTGLSFNTATGIISGTPSVLSVTTTYKVVASNTGGKDSTTLDITVNDVKPRSLSYTTPNVFTNGTAITSLSPSVSGGTVVSYTISPTLPTGLSINGSTGVISGTPSVLSTIATYKVIATNTGGKDSTTLDITVNDVRPSSLTYTSPNTFVKGTTIGSLTPSVSGGPVLKYTISPALSAGLSLDSLSGVISGTPTAAKTITTYTVTAKNSGGEATKSVIITVTDIPPVIVYNPSVYTLTLGSSVTVTPTSTGGTVVTYTISPALPAGLSIDPTSGVISGVYPLNYFGNRLFTVTATNSGGTSTATVYFITNTGPTDLLLSNSNIYENNSIGDVIGNFQSIDYDANDSHTYTLVNATGGEDNSSFKIEGNQLKANKVFNYSLKNVYTIRVRTTDLTNLSYERVFLINISNSPNVTGTSNSAGGSNNTTPTSNPVISKGYSSQLNVNAPGIISYNWSPSTGLSATNIANPIARPTVTTTYKVTVTNSYGSTTDYYITITVLDDFNVVPNNIMTPDGDGINDTWVIENIEDYPNNEVSVFDRAGRLVYQAKNYANTWDGKLEGTPLAEGTYFYAITYLDTILNKTVTKKGYITFIRRSN